MLDAIARVRSRDGRESAAGGARAPPDHGLECVEDERVGPVADRVDADLEPPRGRGPGARLELIDRQQEEP